MTDLPVDPLVPAPLPPATPTTPTAGRRPVPERNAAFDHLALDELRAYRNELTDEETRVSYWRRVLHAQIDLARGRGGAVAQQGGLRRIPSSDSLQSGRTALLRLVPSDGLPVVPDLIELWTALADPAAANDPLPRLEAAEVLLSAYRKSLHVRIDEATAELIARYRERPALAVRALPLTPPMRGRPSGY